MDRIIKIYKEHGEWDVYDRRNNIFRGLAILNEYAEKELTVTPAHDEIFAGLKDEEYEKMTEEDIRALFHMGWFIDEESLAVFC